MSFRALIWAVDQDIDPLEKIVLVTLADHHNGKDGMCFPGLPMLVERTRLGLSTVKKKLASLIAQGLISRYEWGRRSAYLLAIAGVETNPDPDTPSYRKRPPQSPNRASTEPTGLSQSLEWALTEPHNQEGNRESNQEPNQEGPRPAASDTRARQSNSTDLVEIDIARPAHRLPPSWQPKPHHVDKVEARCRAVMTRSGALQLLAERQPGWSDFTREFAERWTAEKADEMRAWDMKARHRNEDWDLRFDAWIDTAFRHLARDKIKPFITVAGEPVTLGDGLTRAVNQSFAESAASADMARQYEQERQAAEEQFNRDEDFKRRRKKVLRDKAFFDKPERREEFEDYARYAAEYEAVLAWQQEYDARNGIRPGSK